MHTLAATCAVIVLTSCSVGTALASSQPLLLAEPATPPALSIPLSKTRFQQRPQGAGTDGALPQSRLLDVNGALYGTTSAGGQYGNGSVFVVTAAGTERVLYSFAGGTDGIAPCGGLIDANGVLYGTTAFGGQYNKGTVFALTTAGAETVLYSFGRGLADGTYPSADLIDINGVLYGTTTTGGLYGRVGPQGYGTVFAVNASGSETVLHNFGSPRVPDGIYPNADLTDVNGVLYGTTNLGGEYGHGLGYGTVFAVTTTGAETLLYSFRSGPADGQNPLSPISFMNGVFYGTTYYGGLYNKGTVFTVTSSGAEGILHSFGHGYDGTGPEGLIDVNGVFYGTTDYGGLYNKGTVFTVTRLGAEHVIHSFGKGADGAVPGASLIYVNGVLYGTTLTGGKYGGRSISGTVFAVTPAGAERVLHSFGGP